MVLPVAPDRPVGIARVTGIIRMDDLVVEGRVAAKARAPDHVADHAGVLVRVVIEGAFGVDLVVTHRKRVLVEVVDRGDPGRRVNSSVAEVPVVGVAAVVSVHRGVVADDPDAGVTDAVVVCITPVGDLAD